MAGSRRCWYYSIRQYHIYASPDPGRPQGRPWIHPNIGMQERRSSGDLVPLQRSRQCSNRRICPRSSRYYSTIRTLYSCSCALTRHQMEPNQPALTQASNISSSTPLVAAHLAQLPAAHQPQLGLAGLSLERVSSRPTLVELTRAA